jgi:hypothetical protein
MVLAAADSEDFMAAFAGKRQSSSEQRKRMRVSGKSWPLCAGMLAILSLASSCNKTRNPTVQAKTAEQKTFASPENAGAVFVEAAKTGDQPALQAIFGPEGTWVLFTGDPSKDKNNLQDFVAAYNQMHRWGKIKPGGEVLTVGADNYLFPIPLAQNSSGQWYFDTAAGKDEILARRIGRGERTAIAACQALADAEHKFFNKTSQYAGKFASDPNKQNGLYWPIGGEQPLSPLGRLGDFGKALGRSNGTPQFNGYYYRILTKRENNGKGAPIGYTVNGRPASGFAILAYPVEYRNTGILSFIVGADGIVYQKDLGEQTDDLGVAADFNPGDGWTPAIPSPPPAPRPQPAAPAPDASSSGGSDSLGADPK